MDANDQLKVMQLFAENNQALDRGDAIAWSETFTEEAVYRDGDQNISGRRALVRLIESRGRHSLERHWSGNLIFEEGDEFTIVSADTAILRGNKVLGTGRSVNRVTCVDGKWQITHQKLTPA